MSKSSNPPENVSSFIDKLLETKDPATVGLRRIIRKKIDDMDQFPLHNVSFEEFHNPAKKGILNEEERRILELEKQVTEFDKLMKKQKDDSEKAVKDAFSKGKAEGVKIGVETGKSEASEVYNKNIEEIQKNVSNCLEKLENAKKNMFSHSDHILLKLSIEMVKKIVASEIDSRQDVILNTIKKALSYIADREKLIIRIAPDDFEIVNQKKSFWEPVNEMLKQIKIEPDQRIDRGGCIIESNNGSVDARIGVQIDEISDLIEKLWTNEHLLSENTENV